MSDAYTKMPKYRSHKEVWALKIVSIRHIEDRPGVEADGSATLTFEEEGYAAICVSPEYMQKHMPQIGGYYVVYEGGYASWSPARVFEDGYTRV